ncbi:tRNA lysidine(34) synthetase TilS [Luteolibacter sp. AS25]|uniref:tRNA lysidine(34) synthetase TilS n=1 Tax=Luteolibacter sp. AS25 TaxID=3135776 RepID=UPI00398AD1C2
MDAGIGLGDCILAGISGGVDSMVLLHLLKEKGFEKVVVCHLNHGLRGEESDGDEALVKSVTKGLGFTFEAGRADVRGLMAAGGSLETVAREARHNFFGKCGIKYECGRLVLAHHADDQAETVLWNLMRGSFGCRGMSAVQKIEMGEVEMEVFRPFLKTRKVELKRWMVERGLIWREDASNGENDVVRNRIRNEVFPLLGDIAKRDVSPLISRSASLDGEWRELLEWSVRRAEALDPQGRIHVEALLGLPRVLQRGVIREFLECGGVPGISGKLLDECLALSEVGNGPAVNLPGGGRLRRRQGRIFLEGI